MPMMDGTGPRGTGRPGRGLGPCRRVQTSEINAGQAPDMACQGLGPRFRNMRKPGLSGMRNRFGGRNRGGGRTR